jgi:putative addiction module component (TIGR02574 family)
MSRTFEEVRDQAMALTPEERGQLAHQLARSVVHSSSEIDKAWQDEVDRRIALQDAGNVDDIDAEVLYREMRQR